MEVGRWKVKTVIEGKVYDPLNGKVFNGRITVEKGKIKRVEPGGTGREIITPPFIDSHVHIESSLLTPAQFAAALAPFGVISAVADPHEIANVLGTEGVKFMVENGKSVPVKLFFAAPSCVPASPLSKAGAVLGVKEVEELLKLKEVKSLGEVMNFPGVINREEEVMAKIEAAKRVKKPIDGHAPGLKGEEARKYFEAGISTDHESTTLEEAEEKIKLGVYIQIREGSAARNFRKLFPLIEKYPEKVMLCTDDRSPDDLTSGTINRLVETAIEEGISPLKALRAASVNPIIHYKLPVGLLRPGDPADFLILESLKPLTVKSVYCNGRKIAHNGTPLFVPPAISQTLNNFQAEKITEEEIRITALREFVKTIIATDGELITDKACLKARKIKNNLCSDTDNDVLKLVVVNRYGEKRIGVGFIKGFNLKRGALAMSIAHDHHNIIALGASDREIVQAVNRVIEVGGGISLHAGNRNITIPLPIAGLMSNSNVKSLAAKVTEIKTELQNLGCRLKNPLITLSFMALEVIPKLKLTDKGLFDSERFELTPLYC